ncbi:hypothetical protein F6Y03_10935 [Bacillus megaterium]|nr:hypothetical protein [Priestia megaterium]
MELKLGVVKGQEFDFIKELKVEEYTAYNTIRKKLIQFQQDQQLYTMINWNYQDIYRKMDYYLAEYSQNPSMNWIKMDIMLLDINRHLLNFLSACRTFLDHNQTRLNKEFGTESEQIKRFKVACSEEYDNYFSYRFFYKLRNYAQHCGMPVGNVSIGEKTVKISGEVEPFLSVQFDRNSLLKNYDSWGKPVKGELLELPDFFEVNGYIDEVMGCFERINFILIEERIPDLLEGTQYIIDLIKPLKEKPGTPCIFNMSDMKSEGGDLKIEWFPLHLVEMVSAFKE